MNEEEKEILLRTSNRPFTLFFSLLALQTISNNIFETEDEAMET